MASDWPSASASLSKYTIVLLGPATLLFIALDPASRQWLRRAEPYIAVAIAVLVAMPVFIWNAEHHWASFAFQGTRRMQSKFRFSAFELLGSILLLLSPLGAAAAGTALMKLRRTADEIHQLDRRLLFAAVYTLMPLAVFVAFSMFHQIKLNWTGPVWLAVIPVIASEFSRAPARHLCPPIAFSGFGHRPWSQCCSFMAAF